MEQKETKRWTKYVSSALKECAKLLQSAPIKYGTVVAAIVSAAAYIIESL